MKHVLNMEEKKHLDNREPHYRPTPIQNLPRKSWKLKACNIRMEDESVLRQTGPHTPTQRSLLISSPHIGASACPGHTIYSPIIEKWLGGAMHSIKFPIPGKLEKNFLWVSNMCIGRGNMSAWKNNQMPSCAKKRSCTRSTMLVVDQFLLAWRRLWCISGYRTI